MKTIQKVEVLPIQKKILCFLLLLLVVSVFLNIETIAFAQGFSMPSINVDFGGDSSAQSSATTVQIILLLTILTLAPSILIMTTCFTRIMIVLSFIRRALALQTTPPNQVLVGLALFLTFFIMAPTMNEIKSEAYDPLVVGEISQEVAFERAVDPLRDFMLRQVRTKDLKLFLDLSGKQNIESYSDVPISTLIPAFIISELKTGFEIGFLIFIPFIVVDMVVASTLMALGMMMLPPVMISLPFKILLFILVDGWHFIIEKLILSIR